MKQLFYFVIFTLALSCSKQTPNTHDPNTKGFDRYVVRTIPGQSMSDLREIIESRGGAIYKPLTYAQGYVVYMPQEEVKFIRTVSRVELDIVHHASTTCERPPPDGPTTPPPPTQPEQVVPWGIEEVRAIAAHQINRGSGVIVCVVDTGIDRDHPDLAGNIVGGQDFTGAEDYQDGHGHGTHVAGTIAAADNSIGVIGVAPEAKIFVARVLDSSGSGFSSDIADGIVSCVNAGALVINMSLGSTSPSTIVHDALIFAQNSGVISVCAAGNNFGSVEWPAAFEECIAVSAVDRTLELADFSSRGPEISFTAPGVKVNSTTLNDSYAEFSGTSMAAPHTAGVFALMLSSRRSVVQTIDIGLIPEYQGAGMIDALGTVQ